MVDSHCHLADDAFTSDLEDVIERAQQAGLSAVLCILDETVPVERARYARIVKQWPAVAAAIGIHPHNAGTCRDGDGEIDQRLTAALDAVPEARAIGEIGLDYHYDFAPRALQRDVFRRQLETARQRDLPVVIHTREADADTLDILRSTPGVRGVFHCFTGDREMARQALDLGFYLSFSGIVTFQRAESIREAAALVPADRLLAETDAPYLSPVPHRGRRNEPARVACVIDVLADVRGESPDHVAAATSESFESLFGAVGPCS